MKGLRVLFRIVASLWLAGTFAVLVTSSYDAVYLPMVIWGAAGGFIFAAIWGTVPILALVAGIRRARAGRLRAALAWCALPAIAILVAVSGSSTSEILRFQLEKPAYEGAVASLMSGGCSLDNGHSYGVHIDLADCREPATVVFDWGGFGSLWRGVVYDAGDQIWKPTRERSPAWRDRDIGRELSCSGAKTDLGGHFYLAGGSYTGGTDDCG